MYPADINNLKECFKILPGVGEKSAERMALNVLQLDQDVIDLFAVSLKNIKLKIKECEICHNITDENICSICSNGNKDKFIICVVESIKDLYQIEKTSKFKGTYHVLGNLISPLYGTGPEDINIKSLIKRVIEEKTQEIILALKPSLEGDTTALYITKMLGNKNVKISKLAQGVPLGTDIEYVDFSTLELAFDDRISLID